MTEQQKKKTVNVEDMQAFARVIHNKGIGTSAVCSTAAATAAKQVVVGTTFSLTTDATCIITFQNAITVASATIAFGTAVDATAEDYASKNPAQEGWYVLSGGAFVLTEDTAPQSGTTYYTVTAAKPIYYRGAALAANVIAAGMKVMLRYNGTQFDIIGELANAYTKAEVDSKLAIYYDPTTKAMVYPADTSRVEYDPTTKGMIFH